MGKALLISGIILISSLTFGKPLSSEKLAYVNQQVTMYNLFAREKTLNPTLKILSPDIRLPKKDYPAVKVIGKNITIPGYKFPLVIRDLEKGTFSYRHKKFSLNQFKSDKAYLNYLKALPNQKTASVFLLAPKAHAITPYLTTSLVALWVLTSMIHREKCKKTGGECPFKASMVAPVGAILTADKENLKKSWDQFTKEYTSPPENIIANYSCKARKIYREKVGLNLKSPPIFPAPPIDLAVKAAIKYLDNLCKKKQGKTVTGAGKKIKRYQKTKNPGDHHPSSNQSMDTEQ